MSKFVKILINEKMATLHIIGNGFDIHHGIASLYSDFREYAWEHSGSDGYWLGQLERCYPTKNKKMEN